MAPPNPARRARSVLFVVLRTAFRALPLRESTRDALRARLLAAFPSIRPLPPRGQSVAREERRARVRADERRIGYVDYHEEALPHPLPAKLVAFYLPQFHAIPENDAWWGKGFTEWRNVTRALPQFEGHLQPRLPGELGFYDLSNAQVMRDQAKLAKTYGLSAFCFYFYWFGGRTLLETPLRNWLEDSSIDLQYCLCWANENWTRRWDGRDGDVLIAQRHSAEDDLEFIAHVADYLRDPRYLRVDGRPVLLLYRPMLLPDPRATSDRWRTWCRDNGIGEIHLAYVQSFERPDPRDIGFDAAVEFPPNLAQTRDITARQRLLNPEFTGEVLDWRAIVDDAGPGRYSYVCHDGINCGWDNTPRRPQSGRVWLHASPQLYRRALSKRISALAAEGRDGAPVFINAWNEWAEGAILEPDAHLGYAWLQATRDALFDVTWPRVSAPGRACVVIHAWYPEVLASLLARLRPSLRAFRLVVTTSPCRHDRIAEVLKQSGVEAELRVYPNRGRDVLPFLHEASRLSREGERIVLKLHTKRSPHRPDGEQWREDILARLLPQEAADSLFALFDRDPAVGVVAPAGHCARVSDWIGANEAGLQFLQARLGTPLPEDAVFPSGSMFWARLDALRPLLDAGLADGDFESEAGQLDGTLAHAVERMIGAVAVGAGYSVITTDEALAVRAFP